MRSKRNLSIPRLKVNSKSKTNNSFLNNPKEIMISILKRIYHKKGPELFTLFQLKANKKKSYILQLKKNDESDFNEITPDMNLHEKEFLSHINRFKKDIIEFENEKNINFKKFLKMKKINDFFGKMYQNMEKKRAKKGQNYLMDKEFFFNIANKYLLKKINLPDLSRNIFKPNPLILENSQIKKFFLNNYDVDSVKFLKFLEKIKNIVDRKIVGNYILSLEERKHLENLLRMEIPKGYIPPEVLIPKLQKEISESQETYDNYIKEYKSKTIEEPDEKEINPKSSKNLSVYNNIIMKIPEIIDNNINKKSHINSNISNSININNNSSIDTTIPIDSKNFNNKIRTPRFSVFNLQNPHTNILVSPIRQKLGSQTLKDIDIFNKDGDKSNQNIEKDFNPLLNSISGKVNNIFEKKSFNSLNPFNEKELSLFQNKKLKLDSPRKKIDFSKLINYNRLELDKDSKDNTDWKKLRKIFLKKVNKDNKYNKSNYLINKLLNNDKKKENDLKPKMDFFEQRIKNKKKYKSQRQIEKERYSKVEKLYNKAMNLKSNSYEIQSELENYIISSKGEKNLSQLFDLKNTYYNISKMERNFLHNKLIQKEYTFRKLVDKNYSFSDKQKKVIDKNESITNSFIKNASKFRKIICEGNKIDNDND